MKWLILLVGVVVVCFVVALVLGLAGGGLGRASASLSHEPLPDDRIDDVDFDDLVFDVGLRGYRMSQVDGVVDRLRRELRERDEEIAVLRGDDPPTPAKDPVPAEPALAPEPDEPDEPDDQPDEPAEDTQTPSGPTVGHERTT